MDLNSCAQKMWREEYWSDEFDDMDEMEEELKDSFEYLEDYYGGHLSVSYEIKEEMELSSRKISDLAAYLEDEYGMNSDKVTEGYLMKVKFTISGDEDDDSITDWIVVYRYDGDWYMDPEAAYYVDSIYDMY